MLHAETTVERTPDVVWAYFTEPSNWEKWWGAGLRAAQWREGGHLEWAGGTKSAILAITPNKMVQIAGSWVDTTWTFEPRGTAKTAVGIREGSPKGGASFSDGGAAHLASLNSYLAKFKEHVERDTPRSTALSAKKRWQFWK